MNIEFLTSEEDVKAVMPEWKRLHEAHSTSLFTHPEWVMCWWEFLGRTSGYQLFIVTLRNDGVLAGIAPLVIARRKGLRLLEWAGADVFDYCDCIVSGAEAGAALWDGIVKCRHYDLARIKDIRPEASCHAPLKRIAHMTDFNAAQYIANHWKTGQEWLTSLGYERRKKIKQRANQLDRAGNVGFNVYRKAPVPVEELKHLVEMKRAWSKATGNSGVFSHPEIGPFLIRLSELAAESGHLHFSTLTVDGAVIASHLGFVYNGILYYYITSYDAGWGKYSPGQQLMCRLVYWTIENELREFDLMRGEERYKSSFADESLKLCDFSFSRGLKGMAGEWYYHWKQQKHKSGSAQV